MTIRTEYSISAFNSIADNITRTAGNISQDIPVSRTFPHRLKATLLPLGSAMDALAKMHATPDPTKTKAYHDKNIITSAARLEKARVRAFDELQRVYRDGVVELQARIDAKVNLKPDVHAQEIRATIRSMSEPDRLAALAQLAATNNGPALAAITEVPSLLSGVGEELKTRFREMIIDTHAKAEKSELEELDGAFNAALRATDVAKDMAANLNNPGRLAEIDRGVNAASAAEAAFNKSAEAA